MTVDVRHRERIDAPSWADRVRHNRRFLAIAAVTVAVYLITTAIVPAFFTLAHVTSTVNTASILGVTAIGAGLVILGGGIDLSIPNVISAAGVFASSVVAAGGSGTVAIVGALGMGILVGAINGVVVSLLGAPPLVVTLAMGGIVQGILLLSTGGTPQSGAPKVLQELSNGSLVFGFDGATVTWVVVGGLAVVLLRKTTLGRTIYAVGNNRRVAMLAGLRPRLASAFTYVASGLTAAAAGLLLLGYTGIAVSDVGDSYLLPGIAAVVLGGVSILGGSGTAEMMVVGVLLLESIEGLLNVTNISEGVRQGLEGGIILLVLAVYSGRLLRLPPWLSMSRVRRNDAVEE